MKDLKAFLEVMGKDKEFSEKVRGAKDVKEMVEIAKEEGYSVTEDEMNDFLMEAVSGGFNFGTFLGKVVDTTVDTVKTVVDKKTQGATWGESLKDGGVKMGTGIIESIGDSLGD